MQALRDGLLREPELCTARTQRIAESQLKIDERRLLGCQLEKVIH